jgi:hypothetical protein
VSVSTNNTFRLPRAALICHREEFGYIRHEGLPLYANANCSRLCLSFRKETSTLRNTTQTHHEFLPAAPLVNAIMNIKLP